MEMNMSDPSLENDAIISKLIYGFGDTLVLKCCVDLEIADTIHKHGQPMTLSQLVSQLSYDHQQTIDIDRLYRLMRYLVHMKIFTQEISPLREGSKYELLPPAKFLLKGGQKSMVGLLQIVDQDFLAPWHYVKDGLSTAHTDPFQKALGMKLFDYLSENPERNQLFNEAMACDSRLLTSELANCQNIFKGTKTLVDIGGGTGTTARAIANAFPFIKCMVYDLPHVNVDSPVDPHIERIDGDIFKSVPKADAILMKSILHDWNDDECIQILKHCKESIPQDTGKIIIIDVVVNVNSNHPYTKARLMSDLDMMINTGGKERTEEEWKKLLEVAGFTGYKLTEISTMQSIIEAFPY